MSSIGRLRLFSAVLLFLLALYGMIILNKDDFHFSEFQDALEFGATEFAVLSIPVYEESLIDNITFVVYYLENLHSIYISKIERLNRGYSYERISPTFTLNIETKSSFEISYSIHGKKFFIRTGYEPLAYETNIITERIFLEIREKQ